MCCHVNHTGVEVGAKNKAQINKFWFSYQIYLAVIVQQGTFQVVEALMQDKTQGTNYVPGRRRKQVLDLICNTKLCAYLSVTIQVEAQILCRGEYYSVK